MPLLEIKLSKKVDRRISLEESTAKMFDRSAPFPKVPADDVMNSSLEYMFSKDKDFAGYLEQNPDVPRIPPFRCSRAARSPAGNLPPSATTNRHRSSPSSGCPLL